MVRSSVDPRDLADRLRRGDRCALARMITLVENGEVSTAALGRVGAGQQAAIVIGVTGYPGVGKSTLVDQLAAAYRQERKRVAILAVDPSSAVSGGALLGDRIRMQRHAGDPDVYIRSMASRGGRGGLAPTTKEVIDVLRVADFDVILLETVGVGQVEGEIAEVADVVLVVVAPGLGDEVQAMKAGLFELADTVVINKADAPGAETAVRTIKEWWPCVIPTVATTGVGIPELIETIGRISKEKAGKRIARRSAE